jgi:regulator of sirC expression with transglutaminase-like and TPR domain
VINTLTWVNLPHEIVVAAHAVGQWADEHAVSDWMIGQCADRRMVDRLTSELDEAHNNRVSITAIAATLRVERDAAIRERDLARAECRAWRREHVAPDDPDVAEARRNALAANPLPEEKEPTR